MEAAAGVDRAPLPEAGPAAAAAAVSFGDDVTQPLLQQWHALSDPATEEALYDTVSIRRFAKMGGLDAVPDEITTLNFRRLLEKHDLARKLFNRVNAYLARKGQILRGGTIVDATIIAAPSSTKNEDGERDPSMHQTMKGTTWHFGMKAHIGVDDESGLVHHVERTAANAADISQAHKLLTARKTGCAATVATPGWISARK